MIYLYHSGMLGAPQLTQTPGAGIAVLDVLVNGFGAGTVDSIIVAGGIATVTRSAGHPFERDAVALIAGATPAALNGEKKVLGATPTAYTFAAPGVANMTATGSITHKLAGAGWLKAFMGTHTAAYKSGAAEATGCLLRVDDADAQAMRCVGYEAMTDIDSGSGPFPTEAQRAGGTYWMKANGLQTAAPWVLLSDGRCFYMWCNFTDYAGVAANSGWGDFVSTKSPDAYGCFHSAALSQLAQGGRLQGEDVGYIGSGSYSFAARNYIGLGGASVLTRAAAIPASMGGGGHSGTFGIPFPNAPDNRMYLSAITLGDAAFGNFRGTLPGVYAICHPGMQGLLANRQIIENVAGYEGRRFMVLNNGSGVIAVDLTGPWR